jgi:hypothetical protein
MNLRLQYVGISSNFEDGKEWFERFYPINL